MQSQIVNLKSKIENLKFNSQIFKWQNSKTEKMNAFEKLIAEFSEMTGLGLVPDERQGCFLETEGIIITIQYRQELDEIVIFAPVTDAEGEAPTKAMYEKALSLSYDGKGTSGASLGLFAGQLILSVHLPMEGLDAQALGTKLMAFADTAVSARAEIAAAGDGDVSGAPEGSDVALSSATMNLADFIPV